MFKSNSLRLAEEFITCNKTLVTVDIEDFDY